MAEEEYIKPKEHLGQTGAAAAGAFALNQNTIHVGPWGGPGGDHFDDGTYDGVREITLTFSDCINSIQVVYEKFNCEPVVAPKHGAGGGQTGQMTLQFPEEYLKEVSGHYSPLSGQNGDPYVRSLKFKSNMRTFEPFGVEQGTPVLFTNARREDRGYQREEWVVLGCHWFSYNTTQTTVKASSQAHQRTDKLYIFCSS